MSDPEGEVVVVTGASAGVGRATARAFIAGYLGTLTSPVLGDAKLAAEMLVRSMTGARRGRGHRH